MAEVSDFTNSDFRKLLSKKPYRGIISEIARERGVTPAAIWMSLNYYNDIEIIALVKQRMRKRDAELLDRTNQFNNAGLSVVGGVV